MKPNNITQTLFDIPVVVHKKNKGNTNHDRKGKFTNKFVSRAERAEKRAEIAEKNLMYISSCYHSIGRQFSCLLRENLELKNKLRKANLL